jgi:hypothetical protein
MATGNDIILNKAIDQYVAKDRRIAKARLAPVAVPTSSPPISNVPRFVCPDVPLLDLDEAEPMDVEPSDWMDGYQ